MAQFERTLYRVWIVAPNGLAVSVQRVFTSPEGAIEEGQIKREEFGHDCEVIVEPFKLKGVSVEPEPTLSEVMSAMSS